MSQMKKVTYINGMLIQWLSSKDSNKIKKSVKDISILQEAVCFIFDPLLNLNNAKSKE